MPLVSPLCLCVELLLDAVNSVSDDFLPRKHLNDEAVMSQVR
tara:strand:+ start:1318 stop:1443 length:126 start_codon:yes stop_codon:yes gene_type:complete